MMSATKHPRRRVQNGAATKCPISSTLNPESTEPLSDSLPSISMSAVKRNYSVSRNQANLTILTRSSRVDLDGRLGNAGRLNWIGERAKPPPQMTILSLYYLLLVASDP